MNYNLITFVGETSGRMSLFGQGAGRYPTAYNVVQDLVDVLEGKSFYAPYGETVAADNSEKLCYYIRGGKGLPAPATEIWGNAAITDRVSVSTVHAWLKQNPDAFIAALQG